jgi:hypothetical protein
MQFNLFLGVSENIFEPSWDINIIHSYYVSLQSISELVSRQSNSDKIA